MDYTLAPAGLLRTAIMLVALTATTIPSTSYADQGGIELANGGRINGDVMVVMPGDHVAIRLADGTAVSVAWADVARVFDGPRVYDASGRVGAASEAAPAATAQPVIPAPTPMATLTPNVDAPPIFQAAPRRDDLAFRLAYENLPRRGGTVMIFSLSGVFTLNGLGMVISGAMIGCYDDYYYGDSYYDDDTGCGFRTGMIAGGTVSLALGAVTFWRAVRRKQTRARGVERLRQGLAARTEGTLDFAVSAQIDQGTFVPRLSLVF